MKPAAIGALIGFCVLPAYAAILGVFFGTPTIDSPSPPGLFNLIAGPFMFFLFGGLPYALGAAGCGALAGGLLGIAMTSRRD